MFQRHVRQFINLRPHQQRACRYAHSVSAAATCPRNRFNIAARRAVAPLCVRRAFNRTSVGSILPPVTSMKVVPGDVGGVWTCRRWWSSCSYAADHPRVIQHQSDQSDDSCRSRHLFMTLWTRTNTAWVKACEWRYIELQALNIKCSSKSAQNLMWHGQNVGDCRSWANLLASDARWRNK